MLIIVMRHHLSGDLPQVLKIAKVVTEAAGKPFRSPLAAQKKSKHLNPWPVAEYTPMPNISRTV